MWTESDTRKVTRLLMLSPSAYFDIVHARGIVLDAETEAFVKTTMAEIEQRLIELSAGAASVGIKELVGDIVFAEGGQLVGIQQHLAYLKAVLASQLEIAVFSEPARLWGS